MLKEIKENIAKKIWDDMLLINGCNNFYQSFSNAVITQAEEDGQKKFYVFDEGNKTIIWAMCCIKGEKCIIPFGPFLSDEVSLNSFATFLNELKEKTGKKIIFSVDNENVKKLKPITKNLKIDWDFTTIILNIKNKSIEEVRANFSENRERIVKKCLINLKEAIITEGKQNCEDFYRLYEKRMQENNAPVEFDLEFLKLIAEQKNTGIMICRNSDYEPMSGLVYFIFGNTITTRYNAFDSKFAQLNPGSYLDFNMITKIVNDENLAYYDMSGLAMESDCSQKSLNVNRYKKTYGSMELVNYKWYKY